MPYLVINTDDKPPLRKVLERAVVLGRSLDCDVSIDDSRLSRQHCRFEPSADGGWSVIDLASTNGTLILGERIATHRLNDGDEVMIGRSRIVFHSRSSPPSRPEKPTIDRSSESARPASPSDTLVDLRFPLPRIEPNPERPQRQEIPKPLAFQRPPATPKVPDAPRQGGILRSFWRRITGKNR